MNQVPTEPTSVVILGAGQAGCQVAQELRKKGYVGPVTLVHDEPGEPYQRPPLSKLYLEGEIGVDALSLNAPGVLQANHIELLRGKAVALNREDKTVSLKDGRSIGYGSLVFATGARKRPLDVPGADAIGVFGLRTLEDADAISATLASIKDAVVVGAGFIGLEFAAVAARRGMRVTVVEPETRPMSRAISEEMSAVFRSEHERRGVRFRFGDAVEAIRTTAEGHVCGVVTRAGEAIPADIVVYGIGVLPNDELAGAAGLKAAGGIVVDDHLLTADPAISAIGDVARFPRSGSSDLVRIESVQNAVDQAKAVALRLCGGAVVPYGALPWFWSDQGDLKLQIAGLGDGATEAVVLGSPQEASVSVMRFTQGVLVAVESLARPADHSAARKILARGTKLDIHEAKKADFDLRRHEQATRA